jgi:hypothetical protein
VDELVIDELVPAGPEREPRGRIFMGDLQVGVYRCSEERAALLLELEKEQQVVVE